MDTLNELLEHLNTLEVELLRVCQQAKDSNEEPWIQGFHRGSLSSIRGVKMWVQRKIPDPAWSNNLSSNQTQSEREE